MNNEIGNDLLLVQASTSLEIILSHFTTECDNASKVEFRQEAELQEQEARSQGHDTIVQWRSVIQQMSLLASHTGIGIAAKSRALQCCTEHGLPIEDDLAELLKSLTSDIERILSRDFDCSCHLHHVYTPIVQ